MINGAQNAYGNALEALAARDFATASGFLKSAEKEFAGDADFRILSESVRLLLAVKEELFELENRNRQEIDSHGEKAEILG